MRNINIIYLLPELKGASGGAKVIYNHSIILNSLKKNISSNVIHLKKKLSYKFETSLTKKLKILDKKIAGWDGAKMKISKSFIPDKKWFNEKINVRKNLNFDKEKDFVIIPEIWSHFAEDLKLYENKINYGIFVQGFYHMNSSSDFFKLNKSYERAKLIITDSKYSIKYLEEMFPKQRKKIIKINFSIDDKKFKINQKSNIITYMPRKLPDHSNLLNFYLKNLLPKNWKIIPLKDITQKRLIDTLARSKIFLSFSNLEGIGIPPIEAALSGNKVIGYVGGGGIEYWKEPIFTKIENGEIRDFGQKILKYTLQINKAWINKTSIHRRKIASQYSKQKEINSLKKMTNRIYKLF